MFFHPAILALLLASLLSALVLSALLPTAVSTWRHWDVASASERQLALERRSVLFATLMRGVAVLQALALLLAVFNADAMAVMFVGAMCAVGTLSFNDWGFPMLGAMVASFFASLVWLALDALDQSRRDLPLVPIKQAGVFVLLPLAVAVFWLQWNYFGGLRADVITSCCGSLFSEGAPSDGTGSRLATLSPQVSMAIYFGALLLAAACALWQWRRPAGWGAFAVAASGIAGWVAGVAGVIAVISLYVYEDPLHHCPFCLLKADYGYLGYLVYVPLFVATGAALSSAALQACACKPGLEPAARAASARWAGAAALGYVIAALAGAALVLSSPLQLIE